MKRVSAAVILACALTAVAGTVAQVPPPKDADAVLSKAYTGKSYSPYAGRGFPSRPFWGDTHLHTDISMDAGAFGNRLGLDDAYRFARGGEVVSSNGTAARLSRPLDFLVIADHSDNMGFFPDLRAGEPHILSNPTGKDWYDRINAGDGVSVAIELIGLFSQGKFPPELVYKPDSAPYKSAWAKTSRCRGALQRTRHVSRRSSATSGPRWSRATTCTASSSTATARPGRPDGALHHPAPSGSTDPRDLWKWLADYEDKTGGAVLAIAHNGNLSNGIMFPVDAQYDGSARRDLRRAARPLGAAVRGHPDQGRRRGAPLPVARRRVRRLRDLGHRQPRRLRGQDRRHAGRRVRARGAEDAACSSRRRSAPTPTSSA